MCGLLRVVQVGIAFAPNFDPINFTFNPDSITLLSP
jgi:hypothetical protein